MMELSFDQALRVVASGGVESGRAVVRTASAGECAKPQGANAGGFLGFTLQAQPRNGRLVAVRRSGVARAVAASPIEVGAAVCIADAEGRVAQLPPPRFTFGTVGANNAVIVEWLHRDLFSLGTTVELVYPGGATTFGWSLAAGQLRITLAGSGGAVTQTASSLLVAAAADAALSRLVRFRPVSGSSGVGTMAAASAAVSNAADLLNPIGIAEEVATQAGDVIPVFLGR